jgi:hypothetical protein
MGGLLLVNLQAISRQPFMAIFNGLWLANREFPAAFNIYIIQRAISNRNCYKVRYYPTLKP